MTTLSPMDHEAIQARCGELYEREIIVTTPDGPAEGLCDGFLVDSDGKLESVRIATYKDSWGAGMGFDVPAASVLDIQPKPAPMYRFNEMEKHPAHRAAFAFPQDRSIVAELLGAIDETFYQIDAHLSAASGTFPKYDPAYAPVELVISDQIQTKRSIKNYHPLGGWSYRVWGHAPNDHEYDATQAAEVMTEVGAGKPLMGVMIDSLDLSPRRDGLRNDAVAQQYLVRLICDYVTEGYFGRVSFGNYSYSEAHSENRTERITLHLEEWEEQRSGNGERTLGPRILPPAIELGWVPGLGGMPENLSGILDVLRKHKLEQLPRMHTYQNPWPEGWESELTDWRL